MYTDQLPLMNIVPLVAFFLVPLLWRAFADREYPRKKELIAYVVTGIALTFLSLFLYGSRGGLPGADVYGWPKEYVIVREGVRGYYPFYFLVDVVFYATLAAGMHGVRKLFKAA